MFDADSQPPNPNVATAAKSAAPIARRRVSRSRAGSNQKVVNGRPPLSNRDFPAAGKRYPRGLNSPENYRN